MNLPVPDLDDRTFQDIVDEAKRRITRLCPGWTDHNVSDPGVAIVELLAWMTELTLFRLNQVPDRMYVKFLELIGVELFGPAPANAELLFELAGARTDVVRIPAATEVATERIGADEPIVFLTRELLTLAPPALMACLTGTGERYEDQWDRLRLADQFVRCFPSLTPGDAVYLGFRDSLRRHLIRLDVSTGPEGDGSDPTRPPLRWQSFDGDGWSDLRVLEDTTGGLNRSGAVTVLLPADHEPLTLAGRRAHWLRCLLVEADSRTDQPTYKKSPQLAAVRASCLGGSVEAHHGEPVGTELLGTSTGEPGQVFQVRRAPVLPLLGAETVRVVPSRADRSDDSLDWSVVAGFADTGEADRVFTWSGASGEVRFGPRVIGSDGTVRQYGAVPPIGAQVLITGYRVGGGARGNVAAGALTALRQAISGVGPVRNLEPAQGGVDAETVENAKLRGPLHLQAGHRAVTAADFEHQAMESTPGLARARCLAPDRAGSPVRVLLVPRSSIAPRSLTLADLAVPSEVQAAVAARLDERRLLTTTVSLEVPQYQGVKIAAWVQAPRRARREVVKDRGEAALYRFVNPLVGGVDGRGWPFGVDLNTFDVARLLTAELDDVVVRRVELYTVDWDLMREEDETPMERLRLAPDALPLSFRHTVVLEQ